MLALCWFCHHQQTAGGSYFFYFRGFCCTNIGVIQTHSYYSQRKAKL